jgi:hypothetical protein
MKYIQFSEPMETSMPICTLRAMSNQITSTPQNKQSDTISWPIHSEYFVFLEFLQNQVLLCSNYISTKENISIFDVVED